MIEKNFVEELRWRGMLHDIMPETEEMLNIISIHLIEKIDLW